VPGQDLQFIQRGILKETACLGQSKKTWNNNMGVSKDKPTGDLP
jgi:hypothetical protein